MRGKNFGKIWRNREGRVRLTWRIATMLLLFFILVFAALIAAATIAAARGIPGELILALLLEWGIWIQQLAMLAVLALFIFLVDRIGLERLGLIRCRGGPAQFLFGLGLGAVLVAAAFIMLRAAGWISVRGGFANLFRSPGTARELALGLLLFVLVGLSEELFFRGYYLVNHTGSAVHAVAVSSILFGAMHLLNPSLSALGLVNIVAAGVLFAYMYLWSGSLYMPIGTHISWNYAMGYIFGFPVSGLVKRGLLEVESTGPDWFTGGAFGPEGGAVATLLLLLGLLAVRAYLRAAGFRCSFGGKVSPGRK